MTKVHHVCSPGCNIIHRSLVVLLLSSLFLFLTISIPASAFSLSTSAVSERRDVLKQLAFLVTMTVPLGSDTASAACLYGDLSKECIGVYKQPANTVEESSSSGLTLEKALKTLVKQRQVADTEIREAITVGRLEDAGLLILALVPRVASAGSVVLQQHQMQEDGSNNNSQLQQLKLDRLQNKFAEALGSFGQCDVSVGQGMRGEMGSITMAQLTILSDLQEGIAALDDFLVMAPFF
jgi:hypothetical protein